MPHRRAAVIGPCQDPALVAVEGGAQHVALVAQRRRDLLAQLKPLPDGEQETARTSSQSASALSQLALRNILRSGVQRTALPTASA